MLPKSYLPGKKLPKKILIDELQLLVIEKTLFEKWLKSRPISFQAVSGLSMFPCKAHNP